MTLAIGTKEDVVNALDELSPGNVSELIAFIEFLRFKSQKQPPRLIKLGGLWQDLPPVSEDDIVEARREMWGQFGERDLL
ncbi:MAG: DUF2281 domain-containing protein [Hyphomicrobiales bacterium]|nr:DUF2281 domain-containing protein [Hyphomicrobiales bacterium]